MITYSADALITYTADAAITYSADALITYKAAFTALIKKQAAFSCLFF